jgi:hypothetical protein
VHGSEITTCHYKGLLREYVMLCYGSRQMTPLVVLRFPAHSCHFCTMWFRQFTQNVTKTDHKDRSHPHSTEHGTQPIAYLISKQVIPYRTRGGTCCPRVSTSMTRSLVDSSMTNHKPWRSQPSPPFQALLKSLHQISPWPPHITTDGRPTLSTLHTSQTQHHKDGKTCTTSQDYRAKQYY